MSKVIWKGGQNGQKLVGKGVENGLEKGTRRLKMSWEGNQKGQKAVVKKTKRSEMVFEGYKKGHK